MKLNLVSTSNTDYSNLKSMRAIPLFGNNEYILDKFISILGNENDVVVDPNDFIKVIDETNNKNEKAIQIILDKKFLDMFDNAFTEIIKVMDDYSVAKWNKIVYDYNKLKSKDESLLAKYLKISIRINEVNYLKIRGISDSISSKQAILLVVYRYSSIDDLVGIKRMTRYIQNSDSTIMTEQVIADIYCKMCGECITNMFCAVMFDKLTDFYSTEENYLYSTINLIILDIIENGLSLDDIYKVLSTYLIELQKRGIVGRFLLKSINVSDYPRINSTIDKLEENGFVVM